MLTSLSHDCDRTGWPMGPWDDEPDDYSWTTKAGFPAQIFRLQSGALAGIVRAPHPPAEGVQWARWVAGFQQLLEEKGLRSSMSSKTDVENVSDFGMSFEHYVCPRRPKDPARGPYITLAVAKIKLEQMACILTLSADDIKKHCWW